MFICYTGRPNSSETTFEARTSTMCCNYIENKKLVSIPELLGRSFVVREMLFTSGKNSFKPNY